MRPDAGAGAGISFSLSDALEDREAPPFTRRLQCKSSKGPPGARSGRKAQVVSRISREFSPSPSVYDVSSAQTSADTPANAADNREHGYRVREADVVDAVPRSGSARCATHVSVVARICIVTTRPASRREGSAAKTDTDGSAWLGCGMKFSRCDACHHRLKKRFTEGHSVKKPMEERARIAEDYARRMCLYEDMLDNYKWRAALPAAKKNRLADTALTQITGDMS